MDETLKLAAAQFLSEFKELAKTSLTVWPREVNTQALLDLNLTFSDRAHITLTLSVEDYSSGPMRDLRRAGDIWIFGKTVNCIEIYIKLKVVEYQSLDTNTTVRQAACISFHPAREPLEYPFKKPTNIRKGVKIMKGFCPSCERETELVHIQKVEEINVKGERIPVEVDRFRCVECGEEFDNPSPAYDPLASAYREYRRRKGMVQPEQILAFREKYNLTQKELSDLLGFGGATLSRYENGTLQDEAHDMILRLVLEPDNLQRIIEERPSVLSEAKRQRILESIQHDFQNAASLIFLRSRTGNNVPNLLNGYRKLDVSRVLSAVKVLTFGGKVYKTKLNKLLFYADFKHFQQTTVSITGLCYAHLPYGPVPDQYELLYESLMEHDPALRKEEDINNDCGGEFFVYEFDPGQAGLSLAEIHTLIQVKEFFKNFTTRKIVDFSHQELAYQATKQGEIISYAFAKDLRI